MIIERFYVRFSSVDMYRDTTDYYSIEKLIIYLKKSTYIYYIIYTHTHIRTHTHTHDM